MVRNTLFPCPSSIYMPIKANLWLIRCSSNTCWTDDDGGYLFTSPRMAQKVFDKYKEELEKVNAKIEPCDLDDDLAQLGNLYH